jgi:microcystin-dependent protein
MQKIVWLCSILIAQASVAQNIGIGTTNPQASFDVRGNLRSGGYSKYMSFDTLSGNISWVASRLFMPAPQYIIQHSASAEGLYYGNSQIEYRNSSGIPVFYTNWNTGNGYFSNNVGIRNPTPAFPLTFDGNLGNKISLWTDGTPTHYGFGVQAGLLQIFCKSFVDAVAFGYGSSTAFTEVMRVNGNGTVGIGTPSPQATLHVVGSTKTNTLQIATGGNTRDFLIKSSADGTVGYRKGFGELAMHYIIAIQGNFPNLSPPQTEGILLGEIRLFSGNYAPAGWAFCEGQILPIVSNQSLFAIIGNFYGGNGQTNFALPDLRDAVPVSVGTNWQWAERTNF